MPDTGEHTMKGSAMEAGWRRRVALALFGCLVLLVYDGVSALHPAFHTPTLVHAADHSLPRAPAFSLPDLEGRTRTLAEFLGLRPLLLEFMAPGCPHCEDMAPILSRLHAIYGTRVQFLTVALGNPRDARRIRGVAEHHQHAWPYLMGGEDVLRAYRLEGVPSFFLLTPDGRTLAFVEGSTTYETLRRGLEAVLEAR
jgi:thiol-disulfide isomerase/thioredoxin